MAKKRTMTLQKGEAGYMYESRLMARYGLSLSTFKQMLAMQNWRCANERCGVVLSWPHKDTNVDHDHADGHVRGILCSQCNMALGHMKDCPDRLRGLADYIESDVAYISAKKIVDTN